jgi:hypothetical protein
LIPSTRHAASIYFHACIWGRKTVSFHFSLLRLHRSSDNGFQRRMLPFLSIPQYPPPIDKSTSH